MTGRGAAGSCGGSPRDVDPVAPVDARARSRAGGERRRRGWAIDTTPLRNPRYRRLFGGVAATMLGQQMTLVAVPFQVYATDRLVAAGGRHLDRRAGAAGRLRPARRRDRRAMDRRRLMMITSTGAAVTSALLAVQAVLPGGGNLAVLWVLTACVSGSPPSTSRPAAAVIPALVGRGVAAANALAMTVRQGGVIVGPLLAGCSSGWASLFLAYLVDAVGFLVAALLLRGLPRCRRGATPGGCGSAPPCAGWGRASRSCAPSRCC